MHAIRQHAFGPPETLRYEEVPNPVPAAAQVLIRVEAAGLHLIDAKIRGGFSGGPLVAPELPMTPGREVAGSVDELGPGVDERWRGRRVVAHLGQASGGYAELAVAPVGALHEIPEQLSAEAAVAMIGTGRTAVGILDRAALTAEDVVLVTAAAGGLGVLFIQAARNAGALAVGVAGGPAKTERVRALGADVAVDYTQPGWPERVREALGEREPTASASSRRERSPRRRRGGSSRSWAGPSRSRRPPRRTPRSRRGPPRARRCWCRVPTRGRRAAADARPPAGSCRAGRGSAPRGRPRAAGSRAWCPPGAAG